MNKIEKEFNKSKKYTLKTNKKDGLVELTADNVAKAEAMIASNSTYLKASDINASPNKKYKGSTAYWINQLKQKETQDNEYNKIIKNIVMAIDRDNSTHINADNKGYKVISNRIKKIPRDLLFTYLKDPEGTNYELIKLISKRTGKTKNSRRNLSFASKFCHYACFYLFKGQKYQDNYSIYDNVLKKALPNYAKKYGIEFSKNDLNDYVKYSRLIKNIINKSCANISKNGFDHLIWYFFKGV